jgi:hypothetical protein
MLGIGLSLGIKRLDEECVTKQKQGSFELSATTVFKAQ